MSLFQAAVARRSEVQCLSSCGHKGLCSLRGRVSGEEMTASLGHFAPPPIPSASAHHAPLATWGCNLGNVVVQIKGLPCPCVPCMPGAPQWSPSPSPPRLSGLPTSRVTPRCRTDISFVSHNLKNWETLHESRFTFFSHGHKRL